MNRIAAAFGMVAVGLLAPAMPTAHLAAQVVRGTVVRQADRSPMTSVIMLVSRVGGGVNHRAVTDSAGRFELRPYPRGRYQVSVERAGGRQDVGTPLALTREDTFTVSVEIPRESRGTPLLRVLSDTRSPLLESVGYYRRGASGAGIYVGPGLLGARNWLTTSEILSHPRVRGYARLRTPFASHTGLALADVRPYDAFGASGGACLPTLFVDGLPSGPAYRDVVDHVEPGDIEGIELYPSYWFTPPEYAHEGSACGAILIWLRS